LITQGSKKEEILSKFALEGRVAIVTGSGSGIGEGIALGFAGVGAHIVVAELNRERCEAVAKKIRAFGGKALPMVTDVLDNQQVKNMVDKTLAEFGKIDILVNNVGGTYATQGAMLMEMAEESWDKVIKINLKSTFLCSKMVSQVMARQKRGNIINIASAAGLRPHPVQLPYGTAKAAIVHFTESMAVQLAQYNIRVNCIAPGKIVTAGTAYLSYMGDSHERARKEGAPLAKAGQTEDAALAAIYLASDASDYVTGVTIPVMGGPYMGGIMMKYAEERWAGKKS